MGLACWPKIVLYEPLNFDRGEIRLLTLLPGRTKEDDTAPVRCRIANVSLGDTSAASQVFLQSQKSLASPEELEKGWFECDKEINHSGSQENVGINVDLRMGKPNRDENHISQ